MLFNLKSQVKYEKNTIVLARGELSIPFVSLGVYYMGKYGRFSLSFWTQTKTIYPFLPSIMSAMSMSSLKTLPPENMPSTLFTLVPRRTSL